MLSRLLLAGLILTAGLLSGCNPSGKLVGKWETDMDRAKSQMNESGNPLAGALLSMFLSSMSAQAEFKADGTCTLGGRILNHSASGSARWRYVRSEGDVLVLMIQPDKANDASAAEKELRLRFVDDDHFEIVSSDGNASKQKLPFMRVNAN